MTSTDCYSGTEEGHLTHLGLGGKGKVGENRMQDVRADLQGVVVTGKAAAGTQEYIITTGNSTSALHPKPRLLKEP